MTLYQLIGKLGLPRWEHVYCQSATADAPYRGKVGVSVDGEIRGNQIQYSIKEVLNRDVVIWTMIAAPVLFPYKVEKIIHWILRKTAGSCKTFEGSSGGTEWFWSNNIITFFFFLTFFWWIGTPEPFYKAIFVVCVPFPLDHCLLIILIALIQYALIVTGFYFLFGFVF